jgi:hypothetical protein
MAGVQFPFMANMQTDMNGFVQGEQAGGEDDRRPGGDLHETFEDDSSGRVDDQGGQSQRQSRRQSQDGGDDEELSDEELLEQLRSGEDEESEDSAGATDTSNENSPEAIKALQTDLAKYVNDSVNAISIPEDAIPENFDPTDSKQLRTVLSTVAKQAVLQAVGLSMKPMQIAVERLGKASQAYVNEQMKSLRESMNVDTTFRELVPEIDDPILKPVVTTLDGKLKAKGKNLRERAVLIRKALDGMGLKSSTKQQSQRQSSSGNDRSGRQSNQNRGRRSQSTSFASGTDALEIFAPIPSGDFPFGRR